MSQVSLIGQGVSRVDGMPKAAGRAVYGSDISLPGMLHAEILASPVPHARIRSVDVSEALAAPGVRAVITGQDVSGFFGPCILDRPVLAKDVVRFTGEPVAAVAAETMEEALRAADLIRVEYEELPGVYDPEKAVGKDAPILHQGLGEYGLVPTSLPVPGTNICHHLRLRRGDVQAGFARADHVFEDSYTVAPNYHACLETHNVTARLEGDGTLRVWAGNQSPYVLQRSLASLFGLPLNRVRVTITTLGGGFGCKIYPVIEPVAVALALRAGGRPVKISLDRRQDFISSVINHAARIYIKTGVSGDGELIARQVTAYWDTGAYADCGPLVARNAGFTAAGPYRIDNISIDSYAVYTNNPVASAFRGYGVPQATWAYECHTDRIARALGKEPLQYRLDNILREGDHNSTGEKLVSVGLEKCILEVGREAGWTPGSNPPVEDLGDGRYRSWGIACSWKASQRPYPTSAIVRVLEDGSVEVGCSTVDMGQGSNTILAQITAQELGVTLERVMIQQPDTFVTPYDRTTSASRSTFHAGMAVRDAARDAMRQLAALAAKLMKAQPGDIYCSEGCLTCRLTGARLTIKETIAKAVPGCTDIIGRGVSIMDVGTGLDPETGQGERPTSFWMYGAHAAEVEVDTRTGKIRVGRVIAAHDVGTAINMVNCCQQIEGGVAMGLGIALTEELSLKEGKILNPNLHDYKIPTPLDMPEITSIIVEVPHPDGPYGAKGLGEPPVGPVAPAVANAVALAAGVWLKDLPLSQERVLTSFKTGGE